MLVDQRLHKNIFLLQISVAEPEPPGAATFRVAPEPELIFFLAGAGSRSRIFFWSELGAGAALFKAAPAPAAYFRQAKEKALFLCQT